MKCVICKNGTIKKGKVTVTLERKGTIILLREVPAQVCDNCEHYFLDEETSKFVLDKANKAYTEGAELEVISLKTA